MQKRALSALTTGLLLVAAQYQGWLAPFALLPLLSALKDGHAFRFGWLAGIVHWGGMCYWIQGTLARHGGMDASLAWLMLILFSLAKGLHLAVFAWLVKPVLVRPLWAPPVAAALWTGLERTHGDFGFAWLTLGNAGIDLPGLASLAPYTGVYGISFLFALTAASVLAATRERRAAAWLLLWMVPFVLPAPHESVANQQAIAVQPNFDEVDPPRDPYYRLFDLSGQGLRQAPRAAAILWPEVPAGIYYDTDLAFRLSANRLARESHANLIIGSVAFAKPGEPRNSAQLIDPQGNPATRYDKVNLVPFGEYVPWPFAALVDKVSSEAGTFTPGERVVVHGQWGTFICYESAFPHFVRQFTVQGAQVLANLTNDGYFAKSAAREQHIALARMRAIENGRWLLRVTNDGYTMSISPKGRIAAAAAPYQASATVLPFAYESSLTVYARYGDWFAWSCLAFGLAFAGRARLRYVEQP
ncbi:MAG: apolipoprotein N-acyltransferase [Bryobacteraceae bacterium]|nr:apolipoprotein N-acyltransferase [Bryobacteraceae bacterium]